MTTDRAALVEEARCRLQDLARLRRRAMCMSLPFHEVSLPQLHILMTLDERGPVTVSELAGLLGVSLPSTSSILDRMEEHGYVRRLRDDHDRRIVRVTLSERGRGALDELTGIKREQAQRLLGSMHDHELLAVICGMDALCAALTRSKVLDDPPSAPERN